MSHVNRLARHVQLQGSVDSGLNTILPHDDRFFVYTQDSRLLEAFLTTANTPDKPDIQITEVRALELLTELGVNP